MLNLRLSLGLGAVGGGGGGPAIVLSGSHSQVEGTADGTAIGVLSVVNGSGSYTFTKTVDADSAFTLTTATIKNNGVVSATHSFTVTADNGVDPVLTATFTIIMTTVGSFLLLADGSSKLLLADGSSRLVLAA